MNDLLILLQYLLSEFFFLLIAVPILFLLIQFLKEFDLSVELLYCMLFLLDLVFERIDLFAV